jgi:hypothetical protein
LFLNSDRLKGMVTPLFLIGDYVDSDMKYLWKCNKCQNEFEDNRNFPDNSPPEIVIVSREGVIPSEAKNFLKNRATEVTTNIHTGSFLLYLHLAFL